jgi:hypothetical protein
MSNWRPNTTDQQLLIEGIASQIRRADANGALPWWHLIGEEERERYRSKARNHIDQVGWNERHERF